MDYEFNQIIFDENIEDVIVMMQRAAIRKGMKARVLEDSNRPWIAKLLILDGVKVMFTPSYDGERCTLEAAVFDKKKIDPKFKTLWDQFQKESLLNTIELSETIDQDTAIPPEETIESVFDKPRTPANLEPNESNKSKLAPTAVKNADEVSEPQSFKLPWEHMEGASEDEKNLVIMWCTQSYKGKELSNRSIYAAPGNILKSLRERYKNADIPKGALKRKQFREKYHRQFLKTSKRDNG